MTATHGAVLKREQDEWSISRVLSPEGVATIYLGAELLRPSCVLPGDETGRLMIALFGLASNGVYLAKPVARFAVGSYIKEQAPPPFQPYLCPGAIGGIFSVALSMGSPPLAVSQHPAL